MEMLWRGNFRIKTQFPRPVVGETLARHATEVFILMTSCVILSSRSVLTAIRFQPPLCLFLPRSHVVRSHSGRRGGGRRYERAQHVGYNYIKLPVI